MCRSASKFVFGIAGMLYAGMAHAVDYTYGYQLVDPADFDPSQQTQMTALKEAAETIIRVSCGQEEFTEDPYFCKAIERVGTEGLELGTIGQCATKKGQYRWQPYSGGPKKYPDGTLGCRLIKALGSNDDSGCGGPEWVFMDGPGFHHDLALEYDPTNHSASLKYGMCLNGSTGGMKLSIEPIQGGGARLTKEVKDGWPASARISSVEMEANTTASKHGSSSHVWGKAVKLSEVNTVVTVHSDDGNKDSVGASRQPHARWRVAP